MRLNFVEEFVDACNSLDIEGDNLCGEYEIEDITFLQEIDIFFETFELFEE